MLSRRGLNTSNVRFLFSTFYLCVLFTVYHKVHSCYVYYFCHITLSLLTRLKSNPQSFLERRSTTNPTHCSSLFVTVVVSILVRSVSYQGFRDSSLLEPSTVLVSLPVSPTSYRPVHLYPVSPKSLLPTPV